MADELAREEEAYEDEELNVGTGWHVDSLQSADWALARLRDLGREAAEVNALEADALTRVKLRADMLRAKAARGMHFFAGRLQEYADSHRADLLGGGKKKSRDLINGTLGWKKTGGGLEVTDEEALLRWARAQPVESGFLRIKEEPAWAVIKAACKLAGEVPPGTEIAEEGEEFFCKTTGGRNGA